MVGSNSLALEASQTLEALKTSDVGAVEVQLAGFQSHSAGVSIGDDLVVDGLDGSLAAIVVGESFQNNVGLGVVLNHVVGAGTAQVDAGAVSFLVDLLGDDPDVGDMVHSGSGGSQPVDGDGGVINSLGVVDVGSESGPAGSGLDALIGVNDVGSLNGIAIVELGLLVQLEGVNQAIIAHGVLGSNTGLILQSQLVHVVQGLEDLGLPQNVGNDTVTVTVGGTESGGNSQVNVGTGGLSGRFLLLFLLGLFLLLGSAGVGLVFALVCALVAGGDTTGQHAGEHSQDHDQGHQFFHLGLPFSV